jgi:hypothetical protein
MIVNRRTFLVKKGKLDELVTMLADSRKLAKNTYSMRIYHSMFGPFDSVAVELEFKDMDEMARSQEEMMVLPDPAAFMAKFDELTVPGGSNEIWVLAQ